jgi:ABC-type Fe3+-hydroxamate transport system substrate-binding protein
MTEQERRAESERLIDEAKREIEAIKEALEGVREPRASVTGRPATAPEKSGLSG